MGVKKSTDCIIDCLSFNLYILQSSNDSNPSVLTPLLKDDNLLKT